MPQHDVRQKELGVMNSSMQNQSIDRPAIITSIPATLIWFGVLAFLAKWLQAWASGRLAPGESSSWAALLVLFLFALLACAGGIYLSIRAWRGKSHFKWQAASLIGAVLLLWTVSGD